MDMLYASISSKLKISLVILAVFVFLKVEPQHAY